MQKNILLGAGASKNCDGSGPTQYQNLASAPALAPPKLTGSMALDSSSLALQKTTKFHVTCYFGNVYPASSIK